MSTTNIDFWNDDKDSWWMLVIKIIILVIAVWFFKSCIF
jgi:hypothetical protein